MPPIILSVIFLLSCYSFMCLQALPFSYFRNDILQPIKSIKIHKEESKDNFGKLKLCPPGGKSFFEALQIACPMRRRKRSAVMFDELLSAIDADHQSETYRPAEPVELMEICCSSGCELMDFFSICGPF